VEHKSFGVSEFKVIKDADEPGTFEALVSVFGNVDMGGDRVKKGAFKRTLEERGLPPIVWSHMWDVPPIGAVLDAAENNQGLRIKGRLFVGEDEDHSVARQVHTAMKAQDGRGMSPLREFSFGYQVQKSSTEEKDGDEIRVLEDVDLFEVGPTLVGMNPDTQLLGVKDLRALLKQDPQPDDNPPPNDPPAVSEEEAARIASVLIPPTPYLHKE
jgi:HK97 family phage prohead protease